MDAVQNTKIERFVEAIEDFIIAIKYPKSRELVLDARKELCEASAEFLKPHLRLV